MRNRILGADPDANTTVCCACGSEKYDEDIFRLHCDTRKIELCEECADDCQSDIGMGSSFDTDMPPKEAFDAIEAWAKLNLVLSFLPAVEQINSLDDVNEFFDALTALLVWHPDTKFIDYVDEKGSQIFLPGRDFEKLDLCMDRCREICDEIAKLTPDVYDLGIKSLQRAGMAPVANDEKPL